MHGVATATACALFGLPCVVYMGEEDTVRQAPNVARMQLLGAEVVTVTSGSRTLKDAMNEAMRDWAGSVRETHYVIGSVAGPHPYPSLVRDLQRVIGDEAKVQFRDAEGRDPDAVVACVGGGSNAMGIFAPFVGAPGTRLVGVEAGGRGDADGEHCRSLTLGAPGVLPGSLSYLLPDRDGQVLAPHPISAGLDYPGGGRAFVPYVTGGLPGVDAVLLRGLEEAGADAVEVGIPFSGPVMDGGVIQEASRLALEEGTRPADVLATVKEAGLSVPVAVMTYFNPVLRRGPGDFLADAA